jgi:hypothetical protein
MYGIASRDRDNKPALQQKSSNGTYTNTQTKTKTKTQHHNLSTVCVSACVCVCVYEYIFTIFKIKFRVETLLSLLSSFLLSRSFCCHFDFVGDGVAGQYLDCGVVFLFLSLC